MPSRTLRWFGAACLCVTAWIGTPAVLASQVEVGAFGGVLAPTSDFAIGPDAFNSPFGATTAKRSTAFTYGLVGRAWFADHLGGQVTFGASDGSLVVQSPLGIAEDSSYTASSTAVTAALLYRFNTPTIHNIVWVSAGVVWMSQDSPRFDDWTASTGIGPTFGAGSTLPVGSRWRVNLMLDTFIYSFNLEAPGAEPLSSSQFDIRGLAGMTYQFGH